MQQLHTECFPITYEKEFYSNSVYGRGVYSCAAVYSPHDVMEPLPNAIAGQRARNEQIVGIITASVIRESDCDDAHVLGFSLWERTVMYILTLGVLNPYRRHGVAKVLLQQLLVHAQSMRNCKAVYLHTAADNTAAASFYEHNGFVLLRRLRDFYVIDGVRHDSLLYVRYINGGSPSCLFSMVSWWRESWEQVARSIHANLLTSQNSTIATPIGKHT